MSALVYTIEDTGDYKRVLIENPIMSKYGEGVVYKIFLGKHLLGHQVQIGTRKTVGDVSLDIKRALHSAEIEEKKLINKIKKAVK